MVQLNCHWAPHWSQDQPPIWLALFWHSNSILFLYLLSTIYNPFLNFPSTYSSLYIVMVQLNRRWAPHRSQDNPHCMTSPPLTLPLYIPFLYSSLQSFSTCSLLPLSPHLSQDHPTVTGPSSLYDFDTPSLHPFSILLIYFPAIRYCCNGAAQLPLGFPPVTGPPTHMTSPLLTIQLYTFFSLPPLYNLHPIFWLKLYTSL